MKFKKRSLFLLTPNSLLDDPKLKLLSSILSNEFIVNKWNNNYVRNINLYNMMKCDHVVFINTYDRYRAYWNNVGKGFADMISYLKKNNKSFNYVYYVNSQDSFNFYEIADFDESALMNNVSSRIYDVNNYKHNYALLKMKKLNSEQVSINAVNYLIYNKEHCNTSNEHNVNINIIDHLINLPII